MNQMWWIVGGSILAIALYFWGARHEAIGALLDKNLNDEAARQAHDK